jgi:hypothetical protein
MSLSMGFTLDHLIFLGLKAGITGLMFDGGSFGGPAFH